MANEKGVVTRTESGKAWVKTVRTSACESCSQKGTCTTLGGGNEMEVEVVNSLGAHVGDKVVIAFDTSPLLKITFLVYVFPILCLIVGAVVGQELAPDLQMNPSMASVLGGLIAFCIAFFPIRIMGNRMAKKNQYQPKIIRIDRSL